MGSTMADIYPALQNHSWLLATDDGIRSCQCRWNEEKIVTACAHPRSNCPMVFSCGTESDYSYFSWMVVLLTKPDSCTKDYQSLMHNCLAWLIILIFLDRYLFYHHRIYHTSAKNDFLCLSYALNHNGRPPVSIFCALLFAAFTM